MFPTCSQNVPTLFPKLLGASNPLFISISSRSCFRKMPCSHVPKKNNVLRRLPVTGCIIGSHAAGTKKPPRWAASGSGSGAHSANALPEGNHLSPLAQLVEVVRPLLHLVEALGQVLGAVVAAPVGILHGMGQVRLNGQRI